MEVAKSGLLILLLLCHDNSCEIVMVIEIGMVMDMAISMYLALTE